MGFAGPWESYKWVRTLGCAFLERIGFTFARHRHVKWRVQKTISEAGLPAPRTQMRRYTGGGPTLRFTGGWSSASRGPHLLPPLKAETQKASQRKTAPPLGRPS